MERAGPGVNQGSCRGGYSNLQQQSLSSGTSLSCSCSPGSVIFGVKNPYGTVKIPDIYIIQQ